MRAAFAVGWILWFAYIVAGVLYALGFASFAAISLQGIWEAAGHTPPDWMYGRRLLLLLAVLATVGYAITLIRKATGGGRFSTVGKVLLFVVLIGAGLFAVIRQDVDTSRDNITPFFDGGGTGLIMAMGFTFIALQGFDLIAAVAGEVKSPGRNIPRAMFLALGCALIIYLPLLLLVSAAGVAPGESIAQLAADDPENVIPIAARRFMGPVGYWLVLVAAVLSTLSALHANIMAASRVALSMAEDRTLPGVLGDLHQVRRTPVMAIYASTLTLIAIAFILPSLAAAGAAASLIFLISFTLAHVTAYLARRRGGTTEAPYRTPWFPAIPIVGGLACAGLGIFQAVAVPDAGGIVLIWLALGVMLYWSLFAHRAEMTDAASAALDPRLVTLRGKSPLVLVPIAHPTHAPAMVAVANALAARKVGRVLLLSIVPLPEDSDPEDIPPRLADVQSAVGQALARSYAKGHQPEALITAAPRPIEEIRRIADEHDCEALLIGLGDTTEDAGSPALEGLINSVDADVAVMRAPEGWRLEDVRRVIVPVGGRGDVHELRARLLGSICRDAPRQIAFVTVVPPDATESQVADVHREIAWLSDLKVSADTTVQIVRASDAASALIDAAGDYDMMVLGVEATRWRKKVFGKFALRMAREAPCATILLSSRPRGAFGLFDPLRRDVLASLRRTRSPPPSEPVAVPDPKSSSDGS